MGMITRQCAKDGCVNTFDVFPSKKKKYCSPECRYSCPDLRGRVGPRSSQHRLTNIDPSEKTATCSRCGPVKIRLKHENGKFTGPKWRCYHRERVLQWQTYGLTQEKVEALLNSQDNVCAICRVDIAGDFQVDHCHKTGEVRGLLCSGCNTGIGLLGDDPEVLRRAAKYVEAALGVASSVAVLT